jgi:hypothetical protein
MLKEKTTAIQTAATPDRSAAMHERGHTYYRTACDNSTACDRAARWAARRLITPRAFLNAARTEHSTDVIAATLNVTRRDVLHYLADLDVDEWLIMQRLIGHPLV